MPVILGVFTARPANTQCADSHCPGSSDAPTFALIALLVVAVLFVVLAVRMWRHGRRVQRGADRAGRDPVLGAVAAVLAGFATLCLVLFGSGFRTYGPNAPGSSAAACQAWWQEAGLPPAAQGIADDSGSVNCRRQAVDAIGPALGEGVVAGLVVGGAVLLAFHVLRRRDRPGRAGNYVYSDLAAGDGARNHRDT